MELVIESFESFIESSVWKELDESVLFGTVTVTVLVLRDVGRVPWMEVYDIVIVDW